MIITATDSASGKSGSLRITVQRDLTDVTVAITPSDPSVQVHSTIKLTAKAKDPSGTTVTANFSWHSQNVGVATVDETGNVTGVSQGSTTITASDSISGKSGTVTLTVTRDVGDVTVTITPANPTVQEHSTVKLTATAKDAGGGTVTARFTWQSLNTAVATVSSDGTVTGVTPGNADVKATDSISSKSATVTVVVTKIPLSGTGKIAFDSVRSGMKQIYLINANGSGIVKQLTSTGGPNGDPIFNRAGTRIAYVSGVLGSRIIYTMNADGSNQQPLVNTGGDNLDPAFSADGSKLAYSSNVTGSYDIYVMDIATGVSTPLTADAAEDYHPSFSPDGSKIVFSSNRDDTANFDVYTMNVDGSGITRLTTDAEWDGWPVYSPSGDMIAFASKRANHSAYQTFLMNTDGSSEQRVYNSSFCTRMPSFSPDGTQIACASNPFNQFDIYIMNIDGTGFTLLTGAANNDFHPSWAP